MTPVILHPAKFLSARRALAVVLLTLGLLAAGKAGAQTQETRMDSILHADRNQTSSFAGKTFASSATLGGKQAQTRSFAFSRSAVLRAGDGSFQTRSFADKGSFRTEGFATTADRASGRDAFAQGNRGFSTKAMAVREAPAAQKVAPGVRPFLPGDKSIVVRGKRQGDLDDLYGQKTLTIDQVRQILNKPGGNVDLPEVKVGPAPVLRAQPANVPAAQ